MGNVISKDGTSIAYERKGEGSPIILVDGAFCSRSFGPMGRLSSLLSERFSVYIYDRRGRGDSGDASAYNVDREIEDLDAILKEAGDEASVFGMSSGAMLSLLAAGGGLPIRKLALFEPPYLPGGAGDLAQGDPAARITELARSGRRGDAVGVFMTQVMGMPEEAFSGMRQAPTFPAMEAVAHTLAYDVMITNDRSLAGKLAQIATPTLVIGGDNSPSLLRQAVESIADAMPHAERRMLSGQTHDVNLDVLAPVLDAFFAS
ncbi:alpha/beta fold hydrolase [Cohnella cellulosilytica]|uniref:Alpha/beta fold hydrolase n=1 Tax=Cohnella cellulosilytica TaxID=986710 RepID=A0ABW2FAK0_9BACL